MLAGACYPLKAWEPGISATESGSPQLVPTPCCVGLDGGSHVRARARTAILPTPTVNGNNNRAGLSPKSGDGLNTAVRKLENWPTPQSHDAKSGMVGSHGWEASGKGAQRNLNDAVLRFPSPCATDYKGAGKAGTFRDRLDYAIERGETKSHQFPTIGCKTMGGASGSFAKLQQLAADGVITEDERRNMASGNGGRLNPDWVEWLMCWPVGWTDIETPTDRLAWLHPSHDPADLAPDSAEYVPRLTTRRKNCANRIKAIGNGQYPATAFVAFAWGLAVLSEIREEDMP